MFYNNCFTFVQSVLEIHLYINEEKEIYCNLRFHLIEMCSNRTRYISRDRLF